MILLALQSERVLLGVLGFLALVFGAWAIRAPASRIVETSHFVGWLA